MVVELKTLRVWQNGLTYEKALKLVEKSGKRLPTNKEIDEILQNDKILKCWRLLPCWTGTYVEYDGEDCTVTENGKKTKIKLPLKNGWYEQDKFGIPSGKPSSHDNPNARYLFRIEKYSGPVTRDYETFYHLMGRWMSGESIRGVDLGYGPSVGLGLAVVKEKNR